MALFVVRIEGHNASNAYCTGESGLTLVAAGDDIVRFEDGTPAIFEDREVAREVAQACHWHNQRFGSEPARGGVRTEGRVVTRADLGASVRSCQADYAR